jgi:hypothetical protein
MRDEGLLRCAHKKPGAGSLAGRDNRVCISRLHQVAGPVKQILARGLLIAKVARRPAAAAAPACLRRRRGSRRSHSRSGSCSGKPGVNKVCKNIATALSLAAKADQRIRNKTAWTVGLAGVAHAHRARNVILDDATVRRIVEAAYATGDYAFGLFVEMLATTGTRPIQAAQLEVGDLQVDRGRLMMPRSAKGDTASRDRRRERTPVPIPAALAAKLAATAAGRSDDAPLLDRGNSLGGWLDAGGRRRTTIASRSASSSGTSSFPPT